MGNGIPLRALWAQFYVELLRVVRHPLYTAIALGLPILFYAMFGMPSAGQRFAGTTAGLYILGSFSCYAVLAITLISFGSAVAAERSAGGTRLIRATPLPWSYYLVPKIVVILAYAFVSIALLTLFANIAAHVHIGLGLWLLLCLRLLAGSIPFTILAFGIAYRFSANTAPSLLSLLNLLLAFGSGLFIPVQLLPHFMRVLAPYLPTYHYGQLAWGVVGGAQEPLWQASLWLAGFTLAFVAFAGLAYRREERSLYA